ncbi:hypothetical protein [Aeromonas simiae]|uniref:hypothetical protein n=1 Tax=Aeromonas simiae TaxID=218936 RepID=UPI0005A61731|nr:hypothetical protein [Aeromonas simiae]
MKKRYGVGLLAALLAGCAGNDGRNEDYRYTAPQALATNNTQTMQIPVDLVWSRAEKWFQEHGLQIENSQRGAGLMTANLQQAADGLKWLDCGTMGAKVVAGDPNVQVNLIITQSGDSSVATVNVKGNTQLFYVEASGDRVPAPSLTPVCVSRGELENSLFASLGD